jgi:DNA modification methylase
MTTAGLVFLLREIAYESIRVVKPAGSFLVFADWRMVPTLVPAIESAGLRYQGLLVWDKGSMGLGNGFRCQHEMILHYTYGSPQYHARDVGNVIKAPRVHHAGREHQTQKPVELLRALIRVVAPPNGVVLDPFAGSGSTGVAAKSIGRKAVLFERDGGHCATIVRRINGESVGPSLFDGAGATT